jgi:ketosteroid isomerase-like protein
MRMLDSIGSLMIATLLVTGCSQPKQASHPFDPRVLGQYSDLLHARDAEGLSKLFTEDAKLMPPDKPIIEGRAAIEEYVKSSSEAQNLPTELQQIDLITGNDFAVRDGTLTQHLLDGSTQNGTFMQLWKFEGTGWKLHRSVWNFSGPPKR